jgi:hypothetical protein
MIMLPNNTKPLHYPATDLRGVEKKRNGQLLDSVEVYYAVSCRYNGGYTRDGDDEWYTGFEVPPPILPEGYKLKSLGVGLQLNARPPYATALMVRIKDEEHAQGIRRSG